MIDPTTQPFYPVTASQPPLRVFVRVLWRGRLFLACREWHPEKKYACWLTYDTSYNRKYLPPRSKRARELWGEDPDGWQPVEPAKWKLPLPEPLPEYRRHDGKERLVNIRARPDPAGGTDKPIDERKPWWWDGTAIKYQPAGEVTPDMAVGRMMRAAACSGAEGLRGHPRKHKDAVFDSTAEAAAEAEREAELAKESGARRERFEPLPQDHADWLTAMAWFAALNPPELRHRYHEPFSLNIEQRIIVWRANCRSWRAIGKELSRSAGYARHQFGLAMERVHRVANGGQAYLQRTSVDRMTALRERNREHRNRGDL